MADGSKYLGAWHDGKMHGQGELTSGDGVTHYKGAYRDGLMHGFGKLKNKLGEYEGEFVDSKMHGKGTSHTFDSPALLNPLASLREILQTTLPRTGAPHTDGFVCEASFPPRLLVPHLPLTHTFRRTTVRHRNRLNALLCVRQVRGT